MTLDIEHGYDDLAAKIPVLIFFNLRLRGMSVFLIFDGISITGSKRVQKLSPPVQYYLRMALYICGNG